MAAGPRSKRRWVEAIRFDGITFQHTDWQLPEDCHPRFAEAEMPPVPPGTRYAAAPQAAVDMLGAITAAGARGCAVEDCTIGHGGGYGIEFGEGCFDNRIVGNHLSDLGAGGIKFDGTNAAGPRQSFRGTKAGMTRRAGSSIAFSPGRNGRRSATIAIP